MAANIIEDERLDDDNEELDNINDLQPEEASHRANTSRLKMMSQRSTKESQPQRL